MVDNLVESNLGGDFIKSQHKRVFGNLSNGNMIGKYLQLIIVNAVS